MNSDDSSSMYSSAETEENERINHHDFQLTHSPSEAWEDHDWSESDTASLGYHALQHQQAISMEASLAAFPRHAEMNIAEDSNSSHPPRHPSAAAASSIRLNIPLPLRFHVPPIPLSPSPSSEASSSSNLSPASSASSSNAPSPASSSGRATSSSSSTSRKRKSTSSSSHSRRHSGSRSSRQAIPAIVSSPPSQAPPTALILQRIPIHSEWRLMNQRKYDQMRRDLLKTLLGKMKTTMASAEKVVQDARRSVEDFSAMSAVPSFSTSSFSGSSSSSSSSGGSPTSDDSRRDSPVESLPMHEVLTQAVQLIRNLTAVKSDLQQTLDGLCDSEEHPGQNAILKQERDRNSMEEDPSILRKGFQKAHYQTESDALSQLDSLVFTLSTLSRHFSSDLNSLQAFSASLSPLLLHPSFSLFSEFGITGCSARIACVMRLEENSPFRLPFSCVPKCLDVGLDFAADFRLPLMTQVHAMAMLLSRRFKYRDGLVRKLDAPPELDELHQLIFESRSSTAEQLSESTEAEEEERCERELLSHPLGQFSLPQSSYRVLQQVLSFLVSLGKFEYERLASTLRPFFSSSYPRDCPSDNHEPFIQFTNHLPAFTIRQLVFSGVNTPTFEHIQAFYALYCGTEDLVTFRACPMPSPHGKLLYLDHDFLILRHPRNGLPLAFILIPRRCYEGEIEVQNLDELNAWPRIDTVVEKQMEKMRLDEKKIPSQLIGGKREQKEDEHDVQLEGPRKKARSL